MPRNAASSMEDAFLQTILDHPDDDMPRLVFADWLEEHSNPRGAFIRLQCQRAKLTPYDPGWKEMLSEESTLLKQFEAEWSKPVLRYVEAVHYRRGFVEHVRVSATKLLKNAERLFRSAPVRSIRLERVDRLAEIAECSWLARVTELDLNRELFGSRSLQTLIRSEHCRSLRVLRLDRCTLQATTIQMLASAANLHVLQTLTLAGNALTEESAASLANSPHLTSLRELNLSDNQLESAGAAALCAAPTFQLTRLSLANNRIGNEGLGAIARCPQLAQLRYLDLEKNSLANLGFEALIQSPHVGQLEYLNLAQNHISSRGVQLLTDSSLLAGLSYLNLRNNEIDKATALTMPQRLRTPKMRELLF